LRPYISAARRALHLMTLDHFMTQPFSALAPAAMAAAEAQAAAVAAAAEAGAYTRSDFSST